MEHCGPLAYGLERFVPDVLAAACRRERQELTSEQRRKVRLVHRRTMEVIAAKLNITGWGVGMALRSGPT